LNLPSPSAKLHSKCGHAFNEAARAAGLTRVRLGNIHLLRD